MKFFANCVLIILVVAFSATGTMATHSMVEDIGSGSYNSSPSELTVFNDKLYFQAYDTANGSELWEYDGFNPPFLVADIASGSSGSYPSDFIVFNGKLYFIG